MNKTQIWCSFPFLFFFSSVRCLSFALLPFHLHWFWLHDSKCMCRMPFAWSYRCADNNVEIARFAYYQCNSKWFNLVFSLESEWYFNYVLCHTHTHLNNLHYSIRVNSYFSEYINTNRLFEAYNCSIMEIINGLWLRNNYAIVLHALQIELWMCAVEMNRSGCDAIHIRMRIIWIFRMQSLNWYTNNIVAAIATPRAMSTSFTLVNDEVKKKKIMWFSRRKYAIEIYVNNAIEMIRNDVITSRLLKSKSASKKEAQHTKYIFHQIWINYKGKR